MSAINPNDAVDFMAASAKPYAEANGQRVYLEEYRKSKKALLMRDAETKGLGKSSAALEMHAYSHPEYIQLLDGLKIATENEERLRWMMVAAQARIEVWRSQEASNRNLDKSAR